MHGQDLSPLLGTEATAWNHPAMLVHTAKNYGSATNKIPGKNDPTLYHGPGIPWYVMLSRGRYKYVRNLIEGETEELYDLQDDPDELTNLAMEARHQDRLRALRAQTIEELKRTDAGFANDLPPVAEHFKTQNDSDKQSANWKKHEIMTAKTAVNSAVANDFNGDGHIDILSSYESKVCLLKGPDWTPITIHRFDPANSRSNLALIASTVVSWM